MKPIEKCFIIVCIAMLSLSIAHCQSVLENFTFEVEAIPNDFGMPGLDTLYTLKCIILTSNSDSISNVQINVGTTVNSNDIYSYSFSNSTTQQLPEGTSFLKQGNKFYIMLGDNFDFRFYYEVKLEDLLGNVSEPVMLTL